MSASAYNIARERCACARSDRFERLRDATRAQRTLLTASSRVALIASCGLLVPAVVMAPPAQATDYYWDVDGATAGAGGTTPSGIWSAGGLTLSTDVNGAIATGPVTTTTADRLFFSAGTDATGLYTITVDGVQNIGRLTFEDGDVILTGGAIDFGAAAGRIDGDATISSIIAGSGSLRFSAGTVTLNGAAANTHSGAMLVGGNGAAGVATLILAAPGGNAVSGSALTLGSGFQTTPAGHVRLEAADQINDTAAVSVNAGHYTGTSTFQLNGFDETIGGINLHKQGAGSNAVFQNGAATDATVTLAGSGTYNTASGDRVGGRFIRDGGTGKLNVVVSLTGDGMQTFAGRDPTYTGTTTVNSGTLRLWNTSLWASDAILNGGTLNFHQTLTAPTAAGSNAPDPRTHANTIGGTGGAVQKTGDGIVILSGVNTYQGATQIDEGVLRAGSTSAFGVNSAVTLADVAGATLDLDGFDVSIGSLAGGGATGGDVTLGAGALTTGGDNTSTTFGGEISGTGGLVKIGAGTQTLIGDAIHTGGTTISAGALQIGDGGTTGSIAGDIVNDATLTFNRSNNLTYAGAITGAGAVNQTGGGVLTLTGDSNYSGATTVTGSTLRLDSGGSIVTSSTTLRGANANLTVAGAGSSLTTGSLAPAPNSGDVVSVNVLNGGVVRTTGGGTTALGGSTIAAPQATVNVDGAGSLLDLSGPFSVAANNGAATFILNVTNGGALQSATVNIGSVFGAPTGVRSVTISGSDSTWTVDGGFSFNNGTVSILDGAVVTADSGAMGVRDTAGLLVSGAGSLLAATGDFTVGNNSGTGLITLADGGRLSVGGQFTLGNLAGRTGILNIGGAEGQAAEAAGALDAATLTFGPGIGRLHFNHTDAGHEFTTAISGAGAINHAAGVTNLTGDSSGFTGLATVSGGTFRVNGTLGDATSSVDVLSGGTLGGAGVIGGDVTVADSGVIAPGNSPGVLTIDGDLALSGGSILDFELGAANVVGGPLNDLVVVGGDLTLDGVIDVTVSSGGSFGSGVYRIFSYGGALTNNTLSLGSMPPGSDVFVQTSVAGQVNLVNTAGLTLNFWDGPAAGKNDADIQGGSGVWRLPDGANEWTDMDGLANVDYAQDGFAVFLGAAGTVSVDNTNGAVGASGMQFGTDGYVIDGDALTLAGASAEIRVGDGSAPSANYVATIATELAGAAGIEKTGAGTLVLTEANSYAGGTAVNDGVLQISSDANLGDAAGDLSFNGGALRTTADLTSARDVNFIGTGEIIADPATTLTLDGALSGAGDLLVSGDGALVLTGASTRTGATTVAAGGLFVEGDQSGASGLTSVLSGAALGGTGAIGGDVAIANGGVLAPGFNAPGALTIGGDLSLSGASVLDFEFGEADAVGGGLNDLVEVGGDLVLDGVINVSVPSGGAFGPGIYRVINYGGALTNNGLALGAGASTDVFVQTSIAGQVNLVNIAGVTLNFWDGAGGGRNDDNITGGDGVWQNTAGNDNWTNAGGALNAPYQNGAFTVFAGTGGAVMVDASLGAVMSAGMQFAADGYTITGDAIDLLPPVAAIQVGDGSGAVYTARIDSALTGAADLIKTGDGVLILGGANTYAGDTTIQGGVIEISSDANLGAPAGGLILDGGGLRSTASFESARNIVVAGAGGVETAAETTLTLSGALSSGGVFTKSGEGMLILTGDSSAFAGTTDVGSGALTVNGSLCGDVNVLAGGRLQGTGTVCTTNNAGVVAPGNSIGTLTVAGDYTGDGGTLEIETVLGGDASPTDRLVVTGDTFGATALRVINLGGGGAQTDEGIRIVGVGGASDGVFTLIGDYTFQGAPAVIGGAYAYRLYQNGVSTPDDGDWYLRSTFPEEAADPVDPPDPDPVPPAEPPGPLYQPGAPLFEAYPQTLAALSETPTLRQRVGDRQWKNGVWGRIEGSLDRARPETSTSRTSYDADLWRIEAGVDIALDEGARGALTGGVFANYARSFADIASVYGSGEIETDAYGGGATLTWNGANGVYADMQGRVTWFDSELASDAAGWELDNDGMGWAASAEIGRRAEIGRGFAVTPQMQYVYSNVDFDRFADPFGAVVASDKGESFRGRFGLELDHRSTWTDGGGAEHELRGYAIANLRYEFLDDMRVSVSGTKFASGEEPLWGGLGLGGAYVWNNRVSLYGEASADTTLNDFGDSRMLTARIGLRAAF